MHAPEPRRTLAATGRADTPTPGTARAERPLMTVEEVIATWQGEWVLMRVLAFDLRGWPCYGEVIAHSPDRAAISDALAEEPRP